MRWGQWRRGRDSNPRNPLRGLTVFETAAFNRSATSPWLLLQDLRDHRKLAMTLGVTFRPPIRAASAWTCASPSRPCRWYVQGILGLFFAGHRLVAMMLGVVVFALLALLFVERNRTAKYVVTTLGLTATEASKRLSTPS